MSVKNTKVIFMSIVFSILETIVFYVIYGLLFLLISLIFSVIFSLPVVKDILGFMLSDADIFAIGFSLIVSYILLGAITERFIKDENKLNLSLFLTGIYLLVINIIFAILNLVYSSSILVNLEFVIAGIVMIVNNKPTKYCN